MKKLTKFLLIAVISFSLAFLVSYALFGSVDESISSRPVATMSADATVITDTPWKVPLRLSDTTEASQYPSVAVDQEGCTNVVWVESNVIGSSIMFAKVSASDTMDVPTSLVYQSAHVIFYPQIDTDGKGNIMLAWGESNGLEVKYYFSRLNHQGEMMMDKVIIGEVNFANGLDQEVDTEATLPTRGMTIPTIEMEDTPDSSGEPPETSGDAPDRENEPDKAFEVGQTSIMTSFNDFNPRVKVDSAGDALVVWADPREGDYDIYLSKITPLGVVTVSEMQLTNSDTQSFEVDMFLDEHDHMHIVYNENSQGQTQVMYAKYDTNGVPLISPKSIMSDMRSYRIEPSIVVNGLGHAHIVYADGRDVANGGSYQIRHIWLDENGIAASEEELLTDGYSTCHRPRLSVDNDNNIHMVWERTTDVAERGGEETWDVEGIFHMLLTENGTEKSKPTVVSDSGFVGLTPQVDIGPNGQPRVVWVDTVDGNKEVYYRQGRASMHTSGVGPTTDIELEEITESETGQVAISTMILGGLGVAAYYGVTIGGKWGLGLVGVPLYSRVKGEKILENDTRANLLTHIKGNPGVTFSELMDHFQMKNGVMAYHLRRLEKEEFIKSSKDGIYKRFYLYGTPNVPTYIQTDILEEILCHPGISQSQIAQALGTSRQVVNYHMNILEREGKIWVRRTGQRTACYPRNVE